MVETTVVTIEPNNVEISQLSGTMWARLARC